jgi:hypothetical protein
VKTTTIELPPTAAVKPPKQEVEFIKDSPRGGIMVIATGKQPAGYKVTEFSTDWDGRAFHLTKIFGGTDRESEAYDVFVGHNERHSLCGCKGFGYSGHCKHLTSLRLLVEAGEFDPKAGPQVAKAIDGIAESEYPESPPPCDYCCGFGVVCEASEGEYAAPTTCPVCHGSGLQVTRQYAGAP